MLVYLSFPIFIRLSVFFGSKENELLYKLEVNILDFLTMCSNLLY